MTKKHRREFVNILKTATSKAGKKYSSKRYCIEKDYSKSTKCDSKRKIVYQKNVRSGGSRIGFINRLKFAGHDSRFENVHQEINGSVLDLITNR